MESNSLPKYYHPIPEENRIKKLFKEYEIKKLGLKKVTDIIRKNMGIKFRCNRTEADYITLELLKPTKETQELIEMFSEINSQSKVISINFKTKTNN